METSLQRKPQLDIVSVVTYTANWIPVKSRLGTAAAMTRDLHEIMQLVNLDRVIHEPARLVILSVLYQAGRADFVSLQKRCAFTKGNLSRHLSKLQAAGYVAIEKKFKGKHPVTECSLTKKGLEAFADYAEQLKGVPDAAGSKSGRKA
jgi:DNA-binding MarR family transcriptional regulator